MGDKKSKVGSVAVGLAGAVVGAAAAAGAIVLADDKNRKRLEKILGELKKEGFKVLEVVQEESKTLKEIAIGKEEKSVPKKAAVKKVAVKKTKKIAV